MNLLSYHPIKIDEEITSFFAYDAIVDRFPKGTYVISYVVEEEEPPIKRAIV